MKSALSTASFNPIKLVFMVWLATAAAGCGSITEGTGSALLTDFIGVPGRVKVTINYTDTSNARVWFRLFSENTRKLAAVEPRDTFLSSGKVTFTAEVPDSERQGTNIEALVDPDDYSLIVVIDESGDGENGAGDRGLKKSVPIRSDDSFTFKAADMADVNAVAVTLNDIIPQAVCHPTRCRFTLPGGDADDATQVVGYSSMLTTAFNATGLTTDSNDALLDGTYDMKCLMDIDEDGTRSVGDYYYEEEGISIDESVFDIAADSFTYQDFDSEPTLNIAALGTYDSTGTATDVDVIDDTAFLSDGANGLVFLDISDVTAITKVQRVNTPGNALKTHVCGDYAYVADDTGGFSIIDISDQAFPEITGSLDAATVGNVQGIFIQGDYAYLASNGGVTGLHIVDISDKTAPSLAAGGTYASATAQDVYVVGQTAFLAAGSAGIDLVNVTDVTAPTQTGNLTSTNDANTVLPVSTGSLFYGDAGGAFKVVDISTPASPADVTNLTGTGVVRSLFSLGSSAFVAAESAGIQIINTENQTSLSVTGNYTGNGTAMAVVYHNRYAYIADGANGLTVINIYD